jgi:hypothetical protein
MSYFPPFSKSSRVVWSKKKRRDFVMPLLGKKTYSFASPPDDIKQNEEVFVIKQTNEVFKSYKYPL